MVSHDESCHAFCGIFRCAQKVLVAGKSICNLFGLLVLLWDLLPRRQVLPVLAHLRAQHPSILGHSLLSQNEVHARLVAAFEALRRSVPQGQSQLKLFVAVADLRNCYDRICTVLRNCF